MGVNETRDYEYWSDRLPEPSLITSQKDGWEAVGLETNSVPPGTHSDVIYSDASTKMYVLGINVGQHINLDMKADGCRKKFPYLTDDFVILPAALPVTVHTTCLHTSLTVILSHDLLVRNVMELWDIEKFELIPSFPIRDPLVTQIVKALQSELTGNPGDCQMYAQTMSNALAVHLLQNFSNRSHRNTYRSGSLPNKKLKMVLDYINSHLEQKIELTDLATLIDYSQYHFSRAFKKSTGLSPYQYVLQQRVGLAKQLLSKQKMSISEVSMACGFSHQSHLNRHFKRLVGTTPKVFQNSQ